MSQNPSPLTFTARLALRWKLLLRAILNLWIKTKILEDADGATGLPAGSAVCYVLPDDALSSLLILDRACADLGLDRPLLPMNGVADRESRAYAMLRRMQGLLVRRRSTRTASPMLRRLVQLCCEQPEAEVFLVPVTVLVGRAPDKETGIAKVLFTEDWEVAGRFSRLLSTLVNGRDTVVQFSRPISLRELADEAIGADRSLRKVSRILRTHFRRVRAAMIGPDLSHRRTMVDGLLHAPGVRAAIEDKARRDGISHDKARQMARKYAREIAANYNYSFVRIAFFLITWFTGKVYRGLHLHRFDEFRREALDYAIVYVPCHRSHADYILLSYLLYTRGLVPPHVAAGLNLNLPVVGRLLRMGGAFYLRRSFRSMKLYSAVFNEYVSAILARGVSMEYFIEGTRSRTGRLLPPKGGMLAMTVRGYLRQPARPVMFQPVYIGYERLLEGSSYASELSGAKKKKESLGGLFRAFGILGNDYGEAHVSFGQPIFLDDLLSEFHPGWRDDDLPHDEKPAWMTPLVNRLGDRILRGINATADVNPVNLLGMILLATPRHALGERELLSQLQLSRSLIENLDQELTVSLTERAPEDIVAYGLELGIIQRQAHALGDIISIVPEQAVGLTYYRNNAAHLFALPSLIASCFLRQRRIGRGQLERIAQDVFPFLHAELYLPLRHDDLDTALQAGIDWLIAEGLLDVSDDGETLERDEGGSESAGRLGLLARSLLPTLQRYYIVVAVLDKNGSGTLSREQLERLCMLTAQRIGLLQEFAAPEFSDRGLFRQFVGELRRLGMLLSNDDNKLEFDDRLGLMGQDARLILDKEIRHSIISVAPSVLETLPGPGD